MANVYDVYFKSNSTQDFDLLTKDIGRRQKAEEKVIRTPIPFRSGDLVEHTGEYESYFRQMTFTSENIEKLSDIYAWLDGYGILRTDQDEGGFFYASVIGDVTRVPEGPFMNNLTVDFLVEPFFYLDSGEQVFKLTESSILHNLGALESQPLITVYGSGDIKLEVNSQTIQLRDVQESITMDSKLKMCYRDTLNMGRKMIGDYIQFEKGDNVIRWTGNVEKVEVVPRWCDR